jgi:hypothetical protein
MDKFAGKRDKPDESVTSGNASDRIQHDFCALAAEKRPNETGFPIISKTKNWVPEDGDEVRVGNLGGKIADKDTVFFRELRLRLRLDLRNVRDRGGWRHYE